MKHLNRIAEGDAPIVTRDHLGSCEICGRTRRKLREGCCWTCSRGGKRTIVSRDDLSVETGIAGDPWPIRLVRIAEHADRLRPLELFKCRT